MTTPAAAELLGKTLAIQEKLAPDSYDVAATELNLGEAIRLQKDLPGAQRHFERALAIREKTGAGRPRCLVRPDQPRRAGPGAR